jgi:hypothetical protein
MVALQAFGVPLEQCLRISQSLILDLLRTGKIEDLDPEGGLGAGDIKTPNGLQLLCFAFDRLIPKLEVGPHASQ